MAAPKHTTPHHHPNPDGGASAQSANIGHHSTRIISARSRYSDPIWDFTVETGSTKWKVFWDTLLDNGQPLSAYPEICGALRMYYEAMLSGRLLAGRRSKIATACGDFKRLIRYIEFLVIERKISSLADVLPSDHMAYLRYLRRRDVSKGTAVNDLSAVIQLWKSDTRMGLHLGLGAKPPFLHDSARYLLGKELGATRKTNVIPDDVLWPLFKNCVEYIQVTSPYLLALKRRYDRYEAKWRSFPIVRGRRNAPKFLCNLFGRPQGQVHNHKKYIARAFARLVDGVALPRSMLLPNGVQDVAELRAELRHLETACFIILGLVTGMRTNELNSIDDDCLVETKTATGTSIYQIEGLLRKTVRDDSGIRCKWICGGYGLLAVTILKSLTEYQRRVIGTRRLFCSLGKTRDQRADWSDRAYTTIQWAKHLPPLVARFSLYHKVDEDSLPRLWDLKPHQLRRTFIRLVVRYGDVEIQSLQLHLKHLNYHMTDYYLGTDMDLWLEFQEANDEMKIKALAEIFGDEHLAGAGGKRQVKNINEAIERGALPYDFRGRAGDNIRLKWAERAMRSGKRINFHATNICDVSNSSESKCNKGGPPLAHLCDPTECINSKIGKIHAPIWRTVLRTAEQALRENKNSDLLRTPLKEQREKARQVLQDLGELAIS